MTDPVNTPTEPPLETAPNSLLGTPPAEPNPTDPPADVIPPTGAPESVDGYEVNVEGFNYDEFKAIPENQEFLERAREAGLDSKSLSFLLGEYNQLIPALMQENAHLDNQACISAMNETWGGEASANFGFAKAAANNAIQNGILTAEEVNSPEFGNNPLVLKMAAYFGSQLGEDTPPSNTQPSSALDIESLMLSEAYNNAGHPEHKAVAMRVSQHFKKQHPDN